MRKRQAFTLIELLVVVAIIGILAAIMFPVFSRARENARRASCLSNVKQMGMAVMMYTQDYDDRYPSAIRHSQEHYPALGNYFVWQRAIQPYAKNFQMFVCPSSPGGYADWDFDSHKFAYVLAGQYGANVLVMRHRSTSASYPYPYIGMAQVVSPASTYLIMDNGSYHASPTQQNLTASVIAAGSFVYLPGSGSLGVTDNGVTDRFTSDFKNGRHFHGLNIAFADGHAKWVKTATVLAEAKKVVDAGWYQTRPYTSSRPEFKAHSAWNPLVGNN